MTDQPMTAAAAAGQPGADARYDLQSFEEAHRRRYDKVLKAIVAVVAVVAVIVAAWQLWEFLRPPDIAAYADEPVAIIGLADAPDTITPEELAELSCQLVSASSNSENTGQGQIVEKTAFGYGPTLEELLGQWGYAIDDFRRIVIRCSDGYETAIVPTALDGEVYLSIARGKDALPEPMQPMRLIMPAMPPGQWAYGIESIMFEA